MGIAPVITDGDPVLGESAVIVEYLLARHGPGALARGPTAADSADCLYGLHFASGTLQPTLGRMMIVRRTGLPDDHPVVAAMRGRLDRVLAHVGARCASAPWLAGASFSAPPTSWACSR